MTRRVALFLACTVALGCTPAPGRVTPSPIGATPKATSPKPGASALPGVVTPAVPPAPLPPGAGVISNNGSNFVGKVRAPAGIVSNNGGRIISDNGGGIISDNGGGFVGKVRRTLLAVDQVPVAGATVRVTDAAGAAVTGPDGKPLTAVTGPDGAYAFPGLTPGQNLLVVAELPAGNGQVQAVALRGQAGAVDLDLVSTLTTAYIHASWVATQADPNATFARLTPDAERDTRAKAAAALGKAGSVELPTFTTADLRTAVDALRKADAALDAQLEVVRQLLLVAGQADLGAGRDAKTVVLDGLTDVQPLPDGTLALSAIGDGRVWRVDAGGVLRVLAGTGRPGEDGPAGRGRPAADLDLDVPRALGLDAQGRLLVADRDRLIRVEPDGTATAGLLLPAAGWAHALLPGRGPDELLVLMGTHELVPHRASDLAREAPLPGAAVPPAHAADPPPGPDDDPPTWQDEDPRAGRAPDGTIHILQWEEAEDDAPPRPLAYTYDPATGRHGAAPALDGRILAVGPDATWFSLAGDGALVATPAAGAPVRYPAAQLARLPQALQAVLRPRGDGIADATVRFAPGGRTLIHDAAILWALAPDGTATHLAGVAPEDARTGTGTATDYDLTDPTGVAIGADGATYVLDLGTGLVLRRGDAGTLTVFCGKVAAEPPDIEWLPDGGIALRETEEGPAIDFGAGYRAPPTEAWLRLPTGLRRDGDGLLVNDDGHYIRRIAADGTLTTLWVTAEDELILDVMPAAGGGYWALRRDEDLPRGKRGLDLLRRHPDGRMETVTHLAAERGDLAAAPDGTPWLRLDQELGIWDGAAFQARTRDPRIDANSGNEPQPARMVVAGDGRVFFATDEVVLAWGAAAGWSVLAGPGGRHFAGASAADGLAMPTALALDAAGGLLIVDQEHDVVRRLGPEQLR